ncbi:MAG: hypothetical protein AAF618_04125 [Pseudomonadota bacterium]
MKKMALALLLLAGPTAALALTDAEQAAYDAVLPSLATALEEQGGEALSALAPVLATCVVTEAEQSEVQTLSGDIGAEETDLVNAIMTRPAVQNCVLEATS